MVVKLIIFLFLLWLGFRIYRQWQSKPLSRNKPAKRIGKDMVACQQCGMHIPLDEAIQSHGKYYCSREHTPD